MKIVVAVDVQNDFVDGVLGTPEAQAAIKDIIDRLMQVRKEDFVIFTRDTHGEHYLEFFIRQIPYLFLFCLVWWAFILFLYLLGIPLSLHLV